MFEKSVSIRDMLAALITSCVLSILSYFIHCSAFTYCLCRPQWERCSEVVAGGAEFWMQAIDGKTSDEIVDLLLAEIQDGGFGTVHGQTSYFEGLVSEDVLTYFLF